MTDDPFSAASIVMDRCRRIQDSGSLARVRRQCYTRAQWDLLAQRQRENSPGMTAMTGSQSGN